MVLIPVSCTMSRTSIYSSSPLYTQPNWFYIAFSEVHLWSFLAQTLLLHVTKCKLNYIKMKNICCKQYYWTQTTFIISWVIPLGHNKNANDLPFDLGFLQLYDLVVNPEQHFLMLLMCLKFPSWNSSIMITRNFVKKYKPGFYNRPTKSASIMVEFNNYFFLKSLGNYVISYYLSRMNLT